MVFAMRAALTQKEGKNASEAASSGEGQQGVAGGAARELSWLRLSVWRVRGARGRSMRTELDQIVAVACVLHVLCARANSRARE